MAYATAILITVLILYCFTISRFRYSWANTPSFSDFEWVPAVKISVVTAFRNESKNISQFLEALKNQDYPAELYEVILVDDGSDDGSQDIVMLFCTNHPQFRYILNTIKPGKKPAVQTGVDHAFGELIVTTDADCTMNPGWLSGIASFYAHHHPDLIIGLVDLAPSGKWYFLYEQVSFLSLVAAGSGAACAGRPLYCNGANMAFTKELYTSLADPMMSGVPSGDDTFLLHAAKRAGKNIRLLKSSKTWVTTEGSKSLQALIKQRIRWTSKAGHYRDSFTIFVAMVVLAMNLSVPVSVMVGLFTGKPWFSLVLFGTKAFTDFMLLSSFMKFLRRSLSPVKFLVFSLIYPFEVLISVFAGSTMTFDWKGRQYRRR
ncbi:MAG TPA: glycosyltransferase [Bacteroidales bacterium]|nr:glycosyltransferase [Bacteroidales bacterium]